MNENCRVCLKAKGENEFIDIIKIIFEEKTVMEIIMDCAQIKVLDNDPLPQLVCINCLKNLQSFYELRQLILKSDNVLKKRLSQMKGQCDNLLMKESTIESNTAIYKLKSLETCASIDNPKSSNKVNDMITKMEIKEECLQLENLKNCDDKTNLNIINDKESPKGTDNHNEHDKEKGINKIKKRPRKLLKRQHECKECNKIFKKADHYAVHMTKHTGEKKYACEFCPKRFARSYVLVYHRRVHTGERPYTCNICSKSFSSPSNFYTHKKIHTGERNYKCELCSESFIQSDSLKIHIRKIHTGERPFLCELCSSAFRSNSSLLTHKLDMHGKKEACPICNNPYSSRVLKEHIRRHKERDQGIKRFVCDQCGKRFTCSSSRKKHLLIHSGEKPFSCEVCQKSFNQRSALKTHMRVHSDFMPFPCDYCSKSFRHKHHLTSHINTHHQDVVEDDTSINICK